MSDESETNYKGARNQRDLGLRGDGRSTEELIRTALAEMKEGIDTRGANDVAAYGLDVVEEEHETQPEASHALAALQSRGTIEVFKVARNLCMSSDPVERVLGATILGQNQVEEKSFPDEKLGVLLGMLGSETEADVLSAICYALGDIGDERAIRHIVPLSTHLDNEVRLSVVHALLHQTDDIAVQALIALSNDKVGEIRDWATFGLGNLRDIDTPELPMDRPELREALAARLDDEDQDTRWEAAAGLGLRGDQRGLYQLREAFEEGWNAFGALEAAIVLAHPSLLPALLGLRREGHHSDLLEEAIEACTPGKQLKSEE